MSDPVNPAMTDEAAAGFAALNARDQQYIRLMTPAGAYIKSIESGAGCLISIKCVIHIEPRPVPDYIDLQLTKVYDSEDSSSSAETKENECHGSRTAKP